MSDEFTITVARPSWTHMRFKVCTDMDEWAAAHPCHRFVDGDRHLLSESCSLCPHGTDDLHECRGCGNVKALCACGIEED